MADNNDENGMPFNLASLLPQREGGHLSDYSHRQNNPPSITNKDDLTTEPTPAQKERLIYLVDDALDTLQDGMLPGNKMNDRISSANSVLDRAGVSGKTALLNRGDDASAISADALVQVIGGLAQMFGKPSSISPKDVTPSPPERDLTLKEEPHEVPATSALNENKQSVTGKEKKKKKSTMPDSLLAFYGADLSDKENE